uniref:Uncharacterized protein n=1 Tax=Rhizophagus irregularis (strain DAOM 181602 / DAOM 197198 / MUCL 43194) TaxID=747089 RepID=U9TH73_RHIID
MEMLKCGLLNKQSKKWQKILSSNQHLKFANINQDNSLNEQDYIIIYYGIQLCIG